jgi:Flp pilus assembly protein TadG
MRDMLLPRFMKDRRGGVAPMFALAVIPVIGLTGAAIDYSRASSARTGMQSAIDATALAMAKLAPTLTPSELQTKTNAYFQAMFNHPDAKNIVITPSYTTTGGSQLTIAVSGSVDTTFMNVLGFSSLNIGSTSTVKWGNNRLRVALVLDNTGSMASAGKIEALKTASKALLTQLKTAATTNGDVYVSIIPFSKDVNVGASNYNQFWVDFGDHPGYDGWDSQNGDDVSTTTCGTKANGKKKKCTTTTSWVPDPHNTWNGCVTDRDQNYDTTNAAPVAGDSKTLFPAEQYDSCPVQLMPLSYDWTALNAKIDSMQPDGNTNQTIGLQWGFQTLTAAPFTIPAKDPNYTYNTVMILLTDGLNTENRFSTTQSAIDDRTKKACDNIKAAGITLYTLQVNTGGDPTSTMLQQCATDTSKNWVVTSSSQIGTIFNQIGTNLSQLRIAK